MKKKGISLIVLIVTIIVMIILAAVVVLTITNNNPIDNAKKATILNDIATLKDEIEIQKVNIGYKEGKTNVNLFGSIEEVLGDDYKAYSKKYAIESSKLVYKDKAFSEKEISILEENGVEKESKYITIVNDSTKEKEENKNNERMVTLKQFQEKITNKEFSETGYNRAYITEDIDVGAKWDENGTLISGEAWTPITSIPKGTSLDGDNHKIKGIYINANTSQREMAFIKENYGIIENLTIDKDCYFVTTSVSFAPLLVYNRDNAKVINCINYANVTAKNETTTRWDINWQISGLVSHNLSIIKDCENYGEVDAKVGGYGVAGVCAAIESKNSLISGCKNYGKVTGCGYGIGGVCGQGAQNGAGSFGTIKNCINYGEVSGSWKLAGIVSRGNGKLSECANYGIIKGNNGSAGIINESFENTDISNCYNFGDLYTNYYIDVYGKPYGGIVCNNMGKISNSYNVGKCYLKKEYKGCQLFYTNTGEVENSYYLNETLDDGTILTEEFMKSDNFLNMLGSEYVKDNSGKNNGYPMLKWQK